MSIKSVLSTKYQDHSIINGFAAEVKDKYNKITQPNLKGSTGHCMVDDTGLEPVTFTTSR